MKVIEIFLNIYINNAIQLWGFQNLVLAYFHYEIQSEY